MKLKSILPYNYFHYYLISIVIGLLAINNIIFILLYVMFFIKIKEYNYKIRLITVTIIILGFCLLYFNINKPIPKNNSFQVIGIKKTKNNNKQYILKQNLNNYLMYSNVDLNIGDNIELDYELRDFKPSRTPNGFNYKNYYGSKKIYYELKEINIKVINRTFHINIIRQNIKEKFNNFPTQTKSYIYMFIFGEDIFDENFNDAKLKLGISHLFALSGLHINLLILFVDKIFKLFNKKRNNIILLTVLFAYLFLAGGSFSLYRAVLMVAISIIFRKKGLTNLDSLSFSFIIILLFRPFAIYNYGFILSYLVSFFIITMPNIKRFNQMLSVNLIAYLSSLLIVSNLNGGIYVFSMLTSFLYSIIFPIIMPIVFLSLIPKFYIISEPLLIIINKISINLAFSPLLKFSFQPLIVVVIYILLIYFLFVSNNFRQILKRSILVVSYLSVIYLSFYINPYYKIDFLDVGQGDSTLIINPYNKGNILIDTHHGTYKYLKTLGPIKIDYLFITHGDYDHASEAVDIVKDFKVSNIYLNPYDNSKIANELIGYNAKKAYPGDVFNIGFTKIEILGPLSNYNNENNNSLVLKVFTLTKTILFTGDIEKEAEHDLANYYKTSLKSDILHIAHHGSNSSSTTLFLNCVRPQEAIISVGEYNSYNHPNYEVVNRLNKLNSVIYLTSEKQTIRKRKIYLVRN